jgi:CopG-like RHH_1 or ribbon-helix-helix domain, RHH_5
MTTLTLPDELVERIQQIAQNEGRSVEDVIAGMVEQLYANPALADDETPHHNPLHGLVGLLDDDIKETDLSSTIRETLKQYTHPQYGWTKRDRTD